MRAEDITMLNATTVYDMIRLRGFGKVDKKFRKNESEPIMPLRGTKYSAGYDFFAPYDFEIKPNSVFKFWTDIKAYMGQNEVLKIYIRSSVGAKKNTILKNNVGVIDKDYYSNEKNDGNIGFFLRNLSSETVYFKKGEGVGQGIFETFLEADNCNTEEQRIGGVGSTNN